MGKARGLTYEQFLETKYREIALGMPTKLLDLQPYSSRRKHRRAWTSYEPTWEVEARCADLLVWCARRYAIDVGFPSGSYRQEERRQWERALYTTWAERWCAENPEWRLEGRRAVARCWLKHSDPYTITNATNSVNSAMREAEARPDRAQALLRSSTLHAQRAIGDAGALHATADVAGLVLGNDDPQVVRFRADLSANSAALVEALRFARPFYERYGLPEDHVRQDLYPDGWP